jgi:hypothetical protein
MSLISKIQYFASFATKILFSAIIIVSLNSCDPSSTETGAISLEELQKFDPIDKGIRYPFKGVDNQNIKWGRKHPDWHHACASEEIQYSLSGDIMGAIPFELKMGAFFVNAALNATGNGNINLISIVTDLMGLDGAFTDHYWDMWNPSCSVIAAVQGVALLAANEAATLACDSSPASGPSSKLKKLKKAAIYTTQLSAKIASSAGGVGLKNIRDAYVLANKCLAARGWSFSMTSIARTLCTGAFTGAAACLSSNIAASKAQTSATLCCSASAAYVAVLTTALNTIKIKYAAARRHQKKVVVCGHDWYGWKNKKYTKKGKEIFTEVRGDYHSNITSKTEDNAKFYSYHKVLLEMNANNTLIRDIKNQPYREYVYGGREIADPTDSDDGGCLMPKIDEDKLKTLFGYSETNNVAGKEEVRQRYYFKGSNTEPNFACQRFQLGKNKQFSEEDQAEFLKAYNCCNNRGKNIICLEYLNDYSARFEKDGTKYDGLVQPYIKQEPKADHSILYQDREFEYNSAAKEANNPIRNNIDFCEVGSRQCSLGGGLDIPIAYEAYEHPLSDKYICARSYSVCPYNFTVGTGTAMGGSDINFDTDRDLDSTKTFNDFIQLNISFSTSKREKNANNDYDCQYLNHCTIVPGDLGGIEYGIVHNEDNYFIPSACSDGRGDSQNYHFQNNLLSKTLGTNSLTAPLAQCVTESFNNLLLNKYGEDSVEGLYLEGDVRNLPSFFNTIQGNLQDILRAILICALALMGYRILLAGGVEKKEIMGFIIKLAFVLYFVSGSAWKTIFSEGLIAISTELSTALIEIDGEDVDVFLNEEEINLVTRAINGDVGRSVESITVPDTDWKTILSEGLIAISTELFPALTETDGEDEDTDIYFGIDKLRDGKLFKLKNKPESGYYFQKEGDKGDQSIYNISSNNICKFPRYNKLGDTDIAPSYPNGKEYIKIFDTLDCMISYALGISALSSGSSFFSTIMMSFLSGFVGMSFAMASLFFAISLLSIAIKILSIFCICIIYLSMLVYISPIAITCVLFGRTKDIFNAWIQGLLSYSIQPALIFMFAGFFISIFNDIVVTDHVRFEHRITDAQGKLIEPNKRVAFINCNNWKIDEELREPSNNSIYCFFRKVYNPNDDKSVSLFPSLEIFGMYFRTSYDILQGSADSVTQKGMGDSKFATMLQIAIILYILNFLATLVPEITVNITSGASVGSVGGLSYNPSQISQKVRGYGDGAKDIARGLGSRYGKKIYDVIEKKRGGARKSDTKSGDKNNDNDKTIKPSLE